MNVQSTALLAVFLAACGGGDRLEREDVSELPAGTATGSAASGTYTIELFTLSCEDSCPLIDTGFGMLSLCDVGDLDDAEVEVTQDGGRLVMDASGLIVDRLSGGLDADGGFEVGAWGTELGAETLVHATGTVGEAGMTGTAASRVVGSYDGQRFDCTSRYELTGARVPSTQE